MEGISIPFYVLDPYSSKSHILWSKEKKNSVKTVCCIPQRWTGKTDSLTVGVQLGDSVSNPVWLLTWPKT